MYTITTPTANTHMYIVHPSILFEDNVQCHVCMHFTVSMYSIHMYMYMSEVVSMVSLS